MGYFEPTSVAEASALYRANAGAQYLAGGATLVALMNAGLAEPTALVSLDGIEALGGLRRLSDGAVRIGAMARHRETAESTLFRAGQNVVPAAARQIANVPVRNMGTMGGSIAFADPAADYPAALRAADARIEIAGEGGVREATAASFFVDWYKTALEPGELVVAITIPPAPAGSVGLYRKLQRVSGDFAIASVALVLALDGLDCREIRLAVGGCGPTPVRLEEAEALLKGGRLESDRLDAAARMIADACDPVDDVRASAEYRRLVVPRMIRRTVADALAELRGGA